MTTNETHAHLSKLDALAAKYAAARQKLQDLQQACSAEIAAVQRKYRIQLRDALSAAIALRDSLKLSIEDRPDTFAKPRTRTLHGIKLGFRKQKGKLTWPKDDSEKVVNRIKKLFPEQVELLIDTVEVPSKTGLAKLSAADLKKLGVSVISDTDEVVIKDAASDLDKIIEQLLGNGDDEE